AAARHAATRHPTTRHAAAGESTAARSATTPCPGELFRLLCFLLFLFPRFRYKILCFLLEVVCRDEGPRGDADSQAADNANDDRGDFQLLTDRTALRDEVHQQRKQQNHDAAADHDVVKQFQFVPVEPVEHDAPPGT